MGAGSPSEAGPNIEHAARAGIERHLERPAVTAQNKRHFVALLKVPGEGGFERERRQNIAVVDQERGVPEQVFRVLDPAAGLQ